MGEPEPTLRFVSDLTLRDLFAAAALAGSLADEEISAEYVAEWAYRCADAMLKAREAAP